MASWYRSGHETIKSSWNPYPQNWPWLLLAGSKCKQKCMLSWYKCQFKTKRFYMCFFVSFRRRTWAQSGRWRWPRARVKVVSVVVSNIKSVSNMSGQLSHSNHQHVISITSLKSRHARHNPRIMENDLGPMELCTALPKSLKPNQCLWSLNIIGFLPGPQHTHLPHLAHLADVVKHERAAWRIAEAVVVLPQTLYRKSAADKAISTIPDAIWWPIQFEHMG